MISTGEEPGHLLGITFVGATETSPLFGVFGDQPIDEAFDLARVHRFETLGGCDVGGVLAARHHLGEHVLGLGCRQLPRGLHRHEVRERCRSEGPGAIGQVVDQMDDRPFAIGTGVDRGEREVGLTTIHDQRGVLGSGTRGFGEHFRCSAGKDRHRRIDRANSSALGTRGTRSGSGKYR